MAPTAVVVGAGLGGLATAALLGKRGWKVTVVEKMDHVGGRCSQTPGGFDYGASIVMFKDIIDEVLQDAGAPHVPMTRLEAMGWQVHAGGEKIDYSKECFERLEIGSWQQFQRFIEACAPAHDVTLHAFHTSHPIRDTPCTSLKAVRDTIVPLLTVARRHFKHPALIYATTAHVAFGGAPTASLCSQIFGSLIREAHENGVYYPKGSRGMGEIPEALCTAICENWNGEVRLGEKVTNIHPGLGVRLASGEFVRSNVIVSNIPYLTGMGLDQQHPASVRNLDYSFSSVNFYWRLTHIPACLQSANTIVIPDGEGVSDCVENGFSRGAPELHVDSPCMYIQCQAHAGQPDNDRVTVLCVFPNLQDLPSGATKEHVASLRAAALSHMGLEEKHILEEEETMTPQRWESVQGLPHGSILGPVYTPTQVLDLRPSQRWKNGVYRVGASTYPATGVPSVMASARLCVQQIIKDTNASALLSAVRTSSTFNRLSPIMTMLQSSVVTQRLRALYAFFRLADDLVDIAPGGRAGVELARNLVERLKDNKDVGDDGLNLVRSCNVHPQVWELFLEGLEADASGQSRQNGLEWYALRVAGVVGEAFGQAVEPLRTPSEEEIFQRRKMGSAIQRLHIVRDYLRDGPGVYLTSLAHAHRVREQASIDMDSSIVYLRGQKDVTVAERFYMEIAARTYERMAYNGYRPIGALRGLLGAIYGWVRS